MAGAKKLSDSAESLNALMRRKLGVRAKSYPAALAKAGRRLPRRLRRRGQSLAAALPMAEHPKLRLLLDQRALDGSAAELRAYLEGIDAADRRRGVLLGVLGCIATNMLIFAGLLIAFLQWRGII